MRQDSSDIRKKILSISYSDWKKLGFSKGTLHYMKKNAEADKPFTLTAHVRERLKVWDNEAFKLKNEKGILSLSKEKCYS